MCTYIYAHMHAHKHTHLCAKAGAGGTEPGQTGRAERGGDVRRRKVSGVSIIIRKYILYRTCIFLLTMVCIFILLMWRE